MWLYSQTYKVKIKAFNTLFGLAFLTLMLNGCSNLSVRQLDSEIQEKLQMIAVQDISSREGQLYTRELRKLVHIGGKTNDVYRLTTKINVSSSSAIGGSTLKKMTMTASFTLFHIESDKILLNDDVIGDAALGTVTSLFGQGKAESHAQERLAILIAQRVVRRLQLFFLDTELYLPGPVIE